MSTSPTPPLTRSADRWLAGVCQGLAMHLGWPVRLVRAGMVLAVFAGGAGAVFYGFLWLFVPTADEMLRSAERRPVSPIAPAVSHGFQPPGSGAAQEVAGASAVTLAAGSAPQGSPGEKAKGRASGPAGAAAGSGASPGGKRGHTLPYAREILTGSGLLFLGGILVARHLGVNVPLGTILPGAAVLAGAAIAWMQLDDARRTGLVSRSGANRSGGWIRLLAGLAMVIGGVLVVVSGSGSWEQTWLALLASIAVLGGVALVLLPWALKFWRDLERERTGRIRETERAEIAAHLHDSVLQTLALIQRRAGSEVDVVRLARAQERELRAWLYQHPGEGAGLMAERLRTAAAEVEDATGQVVDVVCVGDAPVSEQHEALVQACREAMLNAARHGGGAVSVYLEISAAATEVFVRDRGRGFSLATVPADRLGIRESIIGRMRRHGGSAEILSSAEGTDVRLRLPSFESTTTTKAQRAEETR